MGTSEETENDRVIDRENKRRRRANRTCEQIQADRVIDRENTLWIRTIF